VVDLVRRRDDRDRAAPPDQLRLAESLIKRSVGVKDSGALLPGHGGILDRIDAVLFIGPYVYGYLWLTGYPVLG
jgi:hypothetical protein